MNTCTCQGIRKAAFGHCHAGPLLDQLGVKPLGVYTSVGHGILGTATVLSQLCMQDRVCALCLHYGSVCLFVCLYRPPQAKRYLLHNISNTC